MALKGEVMSNEYKNKIRCSLMGHTLSDETRNKISKTKTGIPLSQETIEKQRALRIGHITTDETKRKIGLANKGHSVTTETRQKLRESNLGKKRPIRDRIKISKTMKENKNHLWKGGISFEPYCPKFDEPFKERVRAFFNYCCVECGTPQGKIKLAVHHVHSRKDSLCNSDAPKLFVPLCNGMKGKTSCHSKTEHNRPYWEQHFSNMINSYYEGKCYFEEDEMIAIGDHICPM